MSGILIVGSGTAAAEQLPGFQPSRAASEAEAFSLIRQQTYSIVLLGPEFSKAELINRLRLALTTGSRPTRIIAVLPNKHEVDQMRGLFRAGAADVWAADEVSADALTPLLRLHSTPAGSGTVTIFAGVKGGTGCSTLLLHTLRQDGGRAVVVDLSPYSLHRFAYNLTPMHFLQSLRPHLHHLGAEEVRSVAVTGPRGPAHILLDPSDPIDDDELAALLPPVLAMARSLWDLVVVEIPAHRAALTVILAPHCDRICWITTPDVPCLYTLREMQSGTAHPIREIGRPQGIVVNRHSSGRVVNEIDLGKTAAMPVVGRIPAAFTAFEEANLDRPRYPRALRKALEQLGQVSLTGW